MKQTATETSIANTGTISQVIGPVVDVKFSNGTTAIYNALEIEREDGSILTLEAQQLLSGGIVRAIAMSSTDGLKRGMSVTDTGKGISVPVGNQTLGRMFNVLGEPIDGKEPANRETTLPIHREAPALIDQSVKAKS